MPATVRPFPTDVAKTKTASLQRIPHGGNLDDARSRFPNAPTPWIDLSTGINPAAYPIGTIPNEAWTRLPTAEDEHALLDAARQSYAVSADTSIVAAPGTQALIQTVVRLFPAPTDVAILSPTYSEHAHCWHNEGHHVRNVQHLTEIGSARVVVCVNPNNPTGEITKADALHRLAETLHRRNGLLMIDEAFADATPDMSLAGRLPPSTIILRSFGKFFGLAGLRLGFAICQPATADQLTSMLGPWAVSGPAICIGRQALTDIAWQDHTRDRLHRDCQRLRKLLTINNLTPQGDCPLFQLTTHQAAASAAAHLGQHGIHTRAFTDQPGRLRFGLPGNDEAWDRLANALAAHKT
ncbi:MAG: threonine-phosphate decarboxylase CobD [Pseudomonadota bacterium]